jgi:hypothetical protein
MSPTRTPPAVGAADAAVRGQLTESLVQEFAAMAIVAEALPKALETGVGDVPSLLRLLADSVRAAFEEIYGPPASDDVAGVERAPSGRIEPAASRRGVSPPERQAAVEAAIRADPQLRDAVYDEIPDAERELPKAEETAGRRGHGRSGSRGVSGRGNA